MSDFWVFGYGSLMWRPGFEFAEAVPAHLHGAHRALCIRSHVYRGTPERPGLVLGLDRGGSCRGLAFRVPRAEREPVLAYLRARELVTDAYREVVRPVRLGGVSGGTVPALTYVVNRTHPQYSGPLAPAEVLDIVRESAGIAGPNRDYVTATVAHLRLLGIGDPLLDWLAAELAAEPVTPG